MIHSHQPHDVRLYDCPGMHSDGLLTGESLSHMMAWSDDAPFAVDSCTIIGNATPPTAAFLESTEYKVSFLH